MPRRIPDYPDIFAFGMMYLLLDRIYLYLVSRIYHSLIESLYLRKE